MDETSKTFIKWEKFLRKEEERHYRVLDKIPWDMVIDAEKEVDEEDEENAEN